MAYIENNSLIPIPRKNLYSDFSFNPEIKRMIDEISRVNKERIGKFKEILATMENWQGNEYQLAEFISNVRQLIESNSDSKFNDLISENAILKAIPSQIAQINLAQIYERPLIWKLKLFSNKNQAQIKAYVDTGAAINLIDPSLVKKLNLKQVGKILLDGISTDAPPIYASVVKFDFEIVGKNCRGNDTAAVFKTLERFKTPFVVGMKIFNYLNDRNE
ncbi:MAG: hypothetical protein ACTSXK_13985 [Promethearchaeota archaeon]